MDIGVQKINGIMLDIFKIVISAFLVIDKANRVKFFKENFLVTNISPEVVLGMLFFILSNADIDFLGWKLRWRTSITKKALPTIRCVKLVDKKEFTFVALDPEYETFIVHVRLVSSVPLLNSSPLDVHLSCKPQITGLITKKAPTKVSAEYLDFVNVFSPNLAFELPEYIEINNYKIELVDS